MYVPLTSTGERKEAEVTTDQLPRPQSRFPPPTPPPSLPLLPISYGVILAHLRRLEFLEKRGAGYEQHRTSTPQTPASRNLDLLPTHVKRPGTLIIKSYKQQKGTSRGAHRISYRPDQKKTSSSEYNILYFFCKVSLQSETKTVRISLAAISSTAIFPVLTSRAAVTQRTLKFSPRYTAIRRHHTRVFHDDTQATAPAAVRVSTTATRLLRRCHCRTPPSPLPPPEQNSQWAAS